MDIGNILGGVQDVLSGGLGLYGSYVDITTAGKMGKQQGVTNIFTPATTAAPTTAGTTTTSAVPAAVAPQTDYMKLLIIGAAALVAIVVLPKML